MRITQGVGVHHDDALQLFKHKFQRHPDPCECAGCFISCVPDRVLCSAVDSTEYQKKKKNYLRQLKSLYGIGAAKDYNPYACDTLVGWPRASGWQCHGCPYKVSLLCARNHLRCAPFTELDPRGSQTCSRSARGFQIRASSDHRGCICEQASGTPHTLYIIHECFAAGV